jgi:hypothetical protein
MFSGDRSSYDGATATDFQFLQKKVERAETGGFTTKGLEGGHTVGFIPGCKS